MAGRKWLDSEYIIWKVETREELKEEHPDWTKEQVEARVVGLSTRLFKMGLITKTQLFSI